MNPKVSHGIHKKDLLVKYQEQKHKQQQLEDNAIEEATRLATILVEEFDIEKVYLFGPLAYGKLVEGMPIELALEGIPSGVYGSALGHLKQISTFGIELVDIQQADSWTKQSIVKKGKLLAKKNRP